MNIFVKIIKMINRLIDSFDRKTVEKIKTSYYAFIAVIIITGIIIGYNSGKGSAKKYGKPLNETTNEVFDDMISKGRNKDKYRSMLESELIEEKKDVQLKKVEFPANETMKTELENKVIETDSDKKKSSSLSVDNPKMAEVERTDDKIKKADVKELKKENGKIKINKNTKNKIESQPIDTGAKIIDK